MNTFTRKVIASIGKNEALKAVLSKMFPIAYDKYVHEPLKRKKEYFIKNGIDALSAFHQCMESIGCKYTMAFGSILGAVREKGFIKHDLDIDTFLWVENCNPNEVIICLEKAGFTWVNNYSILNDKFGREDTVKYKGVCIDIFYLYPQINKYPYCCDFVPIDKNDDRDLRRPRRIEMPISKERILTEFENIKVYIPSNAEEFCTYRYGANYMKPDPQWNWEKTNEYIIDWNEMIPYTTHTINPRG